MRLWHYKLISVLPRKQLQGQWREISAISKKLIKNRTLHYGLVKKILNYPLNNFTNYNLLIYDELVRRNIRPSKEILKVVTVDLFSVVDLFNDSGGSLFDDWHNDRYLLQCYYNLQEKYDYGLVSKTDWLKIEETIYKELNSNS